MAKLVFGMNVSLDGYVDHQEFAPGPELFRHWIEHVLAKSLTDLGLIDEYRLYFHPVVLGRGNPFFAGPRPPLRLVASDRMDKDAIRLTYAPA